MPIRFSLPWPPSVNNLYRTDRASGRRFLTSRGRAYESAVAWQVRLLRAEPISGPVSVAMDCYPPDNRRHDIDNVLKAVFDSMTTGAVWEDDSQVRHVEATMMDAEKPGKIVLTVAEMEA